MLDCGASEKSGASLHGGYGEKVAALGCGPGVRKDVGVRISLATRKVDIDMEKVYRSILTGRLVSQAERVAAARTRVVVDRRRGVETPEWIVRLADNKQV